MAVNEFFSSTELVPGKSRLTAKRDFRGKLCRSFNGPVKFSFNQSVIRTGETVIYEKTDGDEVHVLKKNGTQVSLLVGDFHLRKDDFELLPAATKETT